MVTDALRNVLLNIIFYKQISTNILVFIWYYIFAYKPIGCIFYSHFMV